MIKHTIKAPVPYGDRYKTELREVKLTRGEVAIVNVDDYEKISHIKWYASKGRNTFYAQHISKKYGCIRMHRIIMGVNDPKIIIDHINGDGTDNRSENLRIISNQENLHNSYCVRKNNTSGYIGVTYDKRTKKWKAMIWLNMKPLWLGRHATPKLAADAYKKAHDKYFGYLTIREGLGNAEHLHPGGN